MRWRPVLNLCRPLVRWIQRRGSFLRFIRSHVVPSSSVFISSSQRMTSHSINWQLVKFARFCRLISHDGNGARSCGFSSILESHYDIILSQISWCNSSMKSTLIYSHPIHRKGGALSVRPTLCTSLVFGSGCSGYICDAYVVLCDTFICGACFEGKFTLPGTGWVILPCSTFRTWITVRFNCSKWRRLASSKSNEELHRSSFMIPSVSHASSNAWKGLSMEMGQKKHGCLITSELLNVCHGHQRCLPHSLPENAICQKLLIGIVKARSVVITEPGTNLHWFFVFCWSLLQCYSILPSKA